jgi:hypothetical protein
MRALPSATTLCRVLVGLDRTRARGSLYVATQGRRSTISVDAGKLLAAKIDRRVSKSHRQALKQVVEVCGWDGIVLRFAPTNATPGGSGLLEPLAVKTFALSAMRLAVKEVASASVRAQLGTEEYRLSEAGEALVSGIELRPEEATVVLWLRRGVLADEILALRGAGLSGYRFLWMLKLLGCAAPRATGSYPLLLRKRRELRRQASAHALLDLPEGAGSRDARVALRKLVRDIHPDRFGAGTPQALRRASGEIVTALVDAQARIASGQAS